MRTPLRAPARAVCHVTGERRQHLTPVAAEAQTRVRGGLRGAGAERACADGRLSGSGRACAEVSGRRAAGPGSARRPSEGPGLSCHPATSAWRVRAIVRPKQREESMDPLTGRR